MTDYKFKIDTFVLNNKIVTEIIGLADDIMGSTVRKVIDLQDKQIRNALIQLGWTPPETNSKTKGDDKE